jgi:hypothetical protein
MTDAPRDPLRAASNIGAKLWRRALAVPKRAIRIGRRSARLREQASAFTDEWWIEREIAAVAKGRQPIIAGPWLSEVGFEALYWIPFLRWFADRYRVDRERIVALSRGGVRSWYADVAHRYVEIFDHIDPAAFAVRNAARRDIDESGGQKQTTIGEFDRELIAMAERAAGVRDAAVCHPSLMYRLFAGFWLGSRAYDVIVRHTSYSPLTIAADHGLDLPDRFIAAKFYTGRALPDTPACRASLRQIVKAAAARMPVVLLDTGMATDEHHDYPFRDIPDVISLREQLTPHTNLGVQTAVIAASQEFIGTCGSLAWLAPMMGIDTLAVYAEDRLLASHVYVARQVYRQMGAARFDTLDLAAVEQLDLLSPLHQALP